MILGPRDYKVEYDSFDDFEDIAKYDQGDDLDEMLQMSGFTLHLTGMYTAPVFDPAYIPIKKTDASGLYFKTQVTLSDIRLTLQRSKWRALVDAVLFADYPRQTLTLTNNELRELLYASIVSYKVVNQLSPPVLDELMRIFEVQQKEENDKCLKFREQFHR